MFLESKDSDERLPVSNLLRHNESVGNRNQVRGRFVCLLFCCCGLGQDGTTLPASLKFPVLHCLYFLRNVISVQVPHQSERHDKKFSPD